MTAVDHAELKRLAEGATPGEWTCKEGSTAYPECDDKDFWAVVLSPAGKEVVTLHERSSLDDRADYDFDAAFIAAANPAVVLALLSEIEGLKAESRRNNDELLALIDRWEARALEAEQQLADLRTQAPDSWRPIETAPKDGTVILAWCVHPHARWAGDDREWAAPVVTSWTTHNGGGWTWHGMIGEFTHWMPAPSSPPALRPQTAESGK